MKFIFTLIVFNFFYLKVYSQASQIIRGRCINGSNQLPVKNVSILASGNNVYNANTDTSGYYQIIVEPGKYQLIVEIANFKSQSRENIIVEAGKQQVQDFELNEFTVELSVVTVKPEKNKELELTLWNIQQYAAVFYDPARVVNSHAGIVNSDDQANSLTVRGTSPNYIQWKIEGVEVVNPNHLENAGTINDRPALNGGGVSMISAQLLQTSGFQFAPFSPIQGNSLSGLFDLKLRTGNEKKIERTIQASFLGTDICLEGPFSKKSKASYLVNFRYSTVGLLSKMGINFGDEKINYKDFSFAIAYPFKNNITKIFGIIGNSETLFKGKTDSSKIEIQKDLFNIDYHSFTSIAGISMTSSLSNTMYIKTVLAYSIKEVSRSSIPTNILWRNEFSESEQSRQQKISVVCFISKRILNQSRIKLGSYVSYFINRARSFSNDIELVNGIIYEPLAQPFISVESNLLKKLEFNIGLHSMYQQRMNQFYLQPRAMLKYIISNEQDVSFNYGLGSQVQPFYLNLSTEQNKSLKPTQTQNFSFLYNLRFRTNILKVELYYQLYSQVPINIQNSFSAFNYFNEQVNFSMTQNGKGRVYGIDLTFEKHIKGFYVIPSLSIYNSSYTLKSNQYYEGRFNTGYNCVLTAGKEYILKKGKKYLSTDIKAISRNGYKEPGNTDPVNQFLYTSQIQSYFRMDLRISYRKNRERSTVIWALDVQNVSNNKNVAYHYYDRFTQKEEPRYQLGLIPVLSYKILF